MNNQIESPDNNPVNRKIRLAVIGFLVVMVLLIAAYNLPNLTGQNNGSAPDSNNGEITNSLQPAPATVGKPMADFALADINGNQVILSSFQGKTVLLVFFATWCPHCQNEAPILQKAYQAYKSLGFEVVAVSTFSRNAPAAASEARDFAKQYGWTFTTLVDPKNISQEYGITGVPNNIFIDTKGIVRFAQAGGLDEATMVKTLTGLISR